MILQVLYAFKPPRLSRTRWHDVSSCPVTPAAYAISPKVGDGDTGENSHDIMMLVDLQI